MLLLPLAFFLHSLVVLTNAGEASIHDYPWIVSIWKYRQGLDKELRCAGTIISDRVVLTSARCLLAEDVAKHVWVRVGAEDLLNGTDIVWHQSGELHVHQSYSQSGINTWDWRHDVGLIITFSEIEFGPVVQPIQTSSALAAPTIEVELQAFGIVYPGWNNGRTKLLSKKLKIESVQRCQEESGKIYSFLSTLAPSQMCVVDTDQDVHNCPENAGGPVTSCGLLVGIVSWMSGTCFHDDSAVLFTDISWYNEWIWNTAYDVLGYGNGYGKF